MATEHLIPADEFCTIYNVEYAFITSLQEAGLIEITIQQERGFIREEQLQDLEKFIRLHYDLDINLQGLEAISHLLEQVQQLQAENAWLKKKLYLYESSE